jgi:hypothetical protein
VTIVCSVLSTPISEVVAMDWHDVLAWYEEAIDLEKARGGSRL